MAYPRGSGGGNPAAAAAQAKAGYIADANRRNNETIRDTSNAKNASVAVSVALQEAVKVAMLEAQVIASGAVPPDEFPTHGADRVFELFDVFISLFPEGPRVSLTGDVTTVAEVVTSAFEGTVANSPFRHPEYGDLAEMEMKYAREPYKGRTLLDVWRSDPEYVRDYLASTKSNWMRDRLGWFISVAEKQAA